MYAEVNFDSDDGLKREQYRFVLIDSKLVFDSYMTAVECKTYVTKPSVTDVVKVVAKQNLLKQIDVVV